MQGGAEENAFLHISLDRCNGVTTSELSPLVDDRPIHQRDTQSRAAAQPGGHCQPCHRGPCATGDRALVHTTFPIHWAAGQRDKGRLCSAAVGQPRDPEQQWASPPWQGSGGLHPLTMKHGP